MTIKIFYDCEFTHLFEPNIVDEPGLISIALLTPDDQYCYLENQDFNPENCSYFVEDAVLPHLSWYPDEPPFTPEAIRMALPKGGRDTMPAKTLAARLRSFIEVQNDLVILVSDAPSYDWPLVEQLFEEHGGWPHNLEHRAYGLGLTGSQNHSYEQECELAYAADPTLRRHHAGDDVRVIAKVYGLATRKLDV